MNAIIHFMLATSSGAMALLTWHQSMPKIIAMRGRWHGWCEWLLGLGLAMLSPALLSLSLRDAPVVWQFAIADAAFVTYAFCRFRWLRSISDGSWRCSA